MEKKKKNITTIIYLFLVICLAIIPRMWNLTTNPPLIVDEAANIRDIEKILDTGEFNPLNFHWDFSKSQLVYVLPLLINGVLGGDKIMLTLRLTSVVLSNLSLIPFFYIVKSKTTKEIAFSTTLLFSYSYYFLQFSRVGWNDIIMNVTLGLYLIWFMQFTATKGSFFWPVICGFLAALIFYSYRGGIIYILIAPFYLIFLLKEKKVSQKLFIKIFSLYTVTFTLISLPWALKIYKNREKYNLRLNVVSIRNVKNPYMGMVDKTDIYKYQIATSIKSWLFLSGFNGGREENPRYVPTGTPPVNIFVKIIFFIGLIVALFQMRNNFIWLSLYALGIILGQIMTLYPPNGARGLIILPVIYLFFSMGLYKLYLTAGKNKLLLYMFTLLSFMYSYLDFAYYQYWMTWIKV